MRWPERSRLITCTVCGQPKHVNSFERQPDGGAGLQPVCLKCKALRGAEPRPVRAFSAEEQELRRRAQTDLFFLGKEILHFDLEEQPHREMCGFFVAKDPTKPLEEQSEIKERQMLLSRGTFKSTIDIIDSVQWIICFPDVRILCLTAEDALSAAFAQQLKGIFTVEQNHPTEFQNLFPEFCVPAGKRESLGDFTTPARDKDFKEPTFWSNSIMSRLPGWHCNILKLDDVVNDVNSETEEQRDKVRRRVNMARKLRDPGGYIDTIGTPYDPEDYYSYQRMHADPSKFIFIAHPAWEVKEASKRKELTALVESDIDSLYFPSRLSWDYLKNERDNDPESFASQYLIDSRKKVGAIVKFSEELLDSCEIAWESVSAFCSHYAVWDLAYGTEGTTKNKPCMTAGVVEAKDAQNRLITVELRAGYYGPHEIALEIVDVAANYPLQYTAIEDAPGVRWLETEIQTEAQRRGLGQLSIVWIPVDRSEGAKMMRIALVPDLMAEKIMLISSGCINKEMLREHLLKYTGKKRTPMDIADVLGLTARHLGNYVPAPPSDEEMAKRMEAVKDRALREILFPSVGYESQAPAEETVMNYF